jgi:hypothetical protein
MTTIHAHDCALVTDLHVRTRAMVTKAMVLVRRPTIANRTTPSVQATVERPSLTSVPSW